ncbi:MAG: ABC transporter permease [Anaerolineales bacterium]|nr:ABC transporter permease [Anaerolineales bacterium]
MASTAVQREIEYVKPTRQRVMGLVFLGLAAAIWLFFSQSTEAGLITTFKLVPGGVESSLPDWQMPTLITLNLLAIVSAFLGGIQLVRGFGTRTNLVLAIVSGFFLFGFLAWAAADKSLNLAGLLNTTLSKAVPITLGAFSGVLCERAGVVNIAIEGMMLAAAMVGALVGSISGSLLVGLFAAVLTGALLGLVHAVLSIKYLTDQIISGTVINIFAIGITSFISSKFMQIDQSLNDPGIFSPIEIPLLSKIPILGPILFNNNIFIYAMFIFMIVLHIGLFYTRWGLRLRSVGEYPKAADTLGINVFRTRYMAVILGGMMAGFAGGYFTLGSVGRFDEVMTAGRGFIGLAAMIFGNWTPFGSFGAGLLFGFADSLASKLAILGVQIPSQLLGMAPYVATMIILAGVVGRGQMPAADGQPYVKE